MTEYQSMQGKTCLVTGGTAGIGEATAMALARLGARVAIVGRDRAKSVAVATRIAGESGNAAVDYLVADLSSQAQVHRLASEVLERYARLHVLVNNAGAYFYKRQESVDGIEMTLALNHLASFLLTSLLLERLVASAPARIVTVSSRAHLRARIDFDDLQGRRYSAARAYGQSKLANIMFTYELARRLDGTGVTANALSPGLVATGFGARGPGIGPLSKRLVNAIIGISAEKAGERVAYVATSPHLDGITGRYYDKGKPAASSRASYDRDAAVCLWRVSAEMTGLAAASG